jgi:hypothetical protein
MKPDVLVELKSLRLHGMAGAWAVLVEQGGNSGIETSRWLIEHLLQAEGTDRAMRSVSHRRSDLVFVTDKASRERQHQAAAQVHKPVLSSPERQVQALYGPPQAVRCPAVELEVQFEQQVAFAQEFLKFLFDAIDFVQTDPLDCHLELLGRSSSD